MTRATLIGNIKTALLAISTENDYTWDIGAHVYDWFTSVVPVNLNTALFIMDKNDVIESQNASFHSLDLQVTLLVHDSSDSMASIRAKLQDVLTAMKAVRSQEVKVSWVGVEIEAEQQKYKLAQGHLDFVVEYITNEWSI